MCVNQVRTSVSNSIMKRFTIHSCTGESTDAGDAITASAKQTSGSGTTQVDISTMSTEKSTHPGETTTASNLPKTDSMTGRSLCESE
jgi:hypothetical protein